MKTQVIFDMPHDDYLAVDALSSSAIKTINVSVSDYIEGKKQDTSTKAKDLGRAYHKRILEGLEAFQECYTVALDKHDYLNTVDDIKGFIDINGGAYKGITKKDQLADIARSLGGELFSDALEAEEREFISEDFYDRILKFGDHLDGDNSGFANEVTVLWDWEGVPCRARFDAVSKEGIKDLKTFSNPNKIRLDVLPARMISNYRYDIQAVFYTEAYKQARKVMPDFFAAENPFYNILWVQSQGGYNAMNTRLQPNSHELFQVNGYWQKAIDDILSAKDTYLKHIINNVDVPFMLHDDYLEDHHLPNYHFQGN